MSSSLESVNDWERLGRIAHWSSANLARQCGVSPRQLQRFFSARMGTSPQVYLNSLRLGAAVNLLDGHKTVKEVAAMLDFKQPSHFSRQFRGFYGVNPSEVTRDKFGANSAVVRTAVTTSEAFRNAG